MTQKRRRRKARPRGADDASGKTDVPIEVTPDVPPEVPPESEVEAVANALEADALGAAAARADDAEARAAELEDKLKRLQAEFLNETKRIAEKADERRKYAVDGLVRELIPVFDAVHSAREGLLAECSKAPAGEAPLDALRAGLDLLEKELLTVLGRHGVERIEAEDSPFDPGLHEAVFVVTDPDREPNHVAQVLRPGFTLHGRVVRPAHVSVTQAEQDGTASENETE